MLGSERRWKGPSFPSSAERRPRAVIEGGDGAERWIIAESLQEAGFDVARCGGPTENGGPCPLVAGRGCPAVESADVVLNLIGIGAPRGQDVLRAVRAAAPQARIVAQATSFERARLSELLDECACETVTPRASVSEITSTMAVATD